MKPLDELIRPHLRHLVPYSSARDDYDGTEGVFLDANENAYGSVIDAPLHRYPDPYQRAVKDRVARVKGVRPEQIFLGNGSDEPIDLLMRAFGRPGQDQVILLPPTYGMYGVSAGLNELGIKSVPLLPGFQIDVTATLAAFGDTTKLLFVCSPNNPSGNVMDREAVERLLDFPGLIVIDEAYADFSPEHSWLPELDRYPNIVVLQTFSKAWGLAALRLGMAFASPEIIRVLNRIKPPYNVNLLTQQHALAALDQTERKNERVAKLTEQRTHLQKELSALAFVQHVFPSDANFLLTRFDDAATVFRYLIDQQVIVRDRSRLPLCEGCLRVTVGTEAENAVLIDALRRFDSATP
ncbi:MAG: histidinol-phosphate transaminase [Catalinimonas sp.]